MKAMEKDPVNRYQTAKEIIGDLEKIKKDPNVTISSKSSEDEEQFTRVMSPVVVPKTEAMMRMKKKIIFKLSLKKILIKIKRNHQY